MRWLPKQITEAVFYLFIFEQISYKANDKISFEQYYKDPKVSLMWLTIFLSALGYTEIFRALQMHGKTISDPLASSFPVHICWASPFYIWECWVLKKIKCQSHRVKLITLNFQFLKQRFLFLSLHQADRISFNIKGKVSVLKTILMFFRFPEKHCQ